MNNLASKLAQANLSPLSVSYKSSLVLNNLINSFPEAVITTDAHFNITGFNPVAEAIYGFPLKEAIGRYLFGMMKFEIVGGSLKEAIKELHENGFWFGDIIFYTITDQKLYFNSRCTLIKDEAGGISSVVLVNHNISEKIKQDRELAQVENKYQTVVESLSEGVVLINVDGKISTANKKAIEILGLSSEEALGLVVASPKWKAIKEDETVFPLEQFPAIVTLTTGIDKNDVIMGIELPDASRRWISINTRAIYKDGNSLPDSVIASFKDITAIKKASEQLKESEVLFRSFMQNSQTANWIYDEDGYIVMANEIYSKITGYEGSTIGKHILDIFPNEFGEKLVARNKEFLKHKTPIMSPNSLVQADGTEKHFISYLFHISLPNNKQLIGGQAIDITEEKKAIEKLSENEVMFRSFMSNSHNLGWVYDVNGNLVYGNPVLMETVGLSEESIGKNIYEVTNRRVAAAILEKNKKVLETGEVIISEDRFVDRNGQTKHFIAHYFLLTFGDKKFVGGHALDVTERKKMQAELVNEQIQKQKQINQATLEAQEEERNRISGELHDNVNQLLMSSKLHIGAAKKATNNQGELLDKATEYLMMAVEEIRALTKSLNSSAVSTVGLYSSITDIAKNLEQLNHIETTIDISEDAVSVLSEEQRLMIYRIVQEQSNNIIKYADASAANISLKKVNKYCQLTISDNGKGFDKDKTELKGIGLINIFNRVDAYNGRVKIETSPGNGVTLKIIFPFAG